MASSTSPNFTLLDRPEISSAIFHPRAEWGGASEPDAHREHLIEVASDVHIGARFHLASLSGANILFFHGNGEIVADYDDLGPLYNELDINFLAVDYRGYGRSTGEPTVGGMMADCHAILSYASNWLKHSGYRGPLVAMGRSLGSASALELAAARPKEIDGLIIESGFAFAEPLLRLLGVNIDSIGFKEDQGFRNIDKIKQYTGPTLIIHAQYDHIIPFSEGQALYQACQAQRKQFLQIDGANHNDIFSKGLNPYLQSIHHLIQRILSE